MRMLHACNNTKPTKDGAVVSVTMAEFYSLWTSRETVMDELETLTR
jgi:hypothetical protein